MRAKIKSDKFQVLYHKLTSLDREKNICKEITMQSPIVLVLICDTENINCSVFPAHFLSFYIASSFFSQYLLPGATQITSSIFFGIFLQETEVACNKILSQIVLKGFWATKDMK